MTTIDLGALLQDSGAILKGHFVLTSGRHSDTYFEKFRVIERPDVLSTLCTEIAEAFKDSGIEFVAGPTTGGIIIAFEVARQMGLPAIYVETENGVKTLRRGASIPAGAKVLVVDDVLTTGRSIFEVEEVIKAHGAIMQGVGVLISRSEKPVDFGTELHAAYTVSATSYAPDDIPEELAKLPITKPGTRK